jgi:hypothetical protein
MKARLAALQRALAGLFGLREAFVFGGLAAASYGVAQIHVPSAWIVAGVVVFLLGVRR